MRANRAGVRRRLRPSPDPLLIDKVRDVVGLYMNPPDHALVLCVDEKSQIQALDRTQPLLPMRPGKLNAAPTTTSATAPRRSLNTHGVRVSTRTIGTGR